MGRAKDTTMQADRSTYGPRIDAYLRFFTQPVDATKWKPLFQNEEPLQLGYAYREEKPHDWMGCMETKRCCFGSDSPCSFYVKCVATLKYRDRILEEDIEFPPQWWIENYRNYGQEIQLPDSNVTMTVRLCEREGQPNSWEVWCGLYPCQPQRKYADMLDLVHRF